MDDIPDFLRVENRNKPMVKPLVYTFTNLNCYDGICPHQFYRRYVKKDLKFVETPQMKWGNDVHKAFEDRIAGGKPLPDSMRQWEHHVVPFAGLKAKVEWKLGVVKKGTPADFWATDVFLRGKLDCAVINGNVAFLADWKTGKVREDPFELEVGAMLLRMNMPNISTVFGSYVWLGEDRVGQRHDLSNTEATTQRVAAIVKKIEADLVVGEFEKRPGGLCGWCDVMDCQHNRKQK